MKKILPALVVLVLTGLYAMAQHSELHCGTDEMRHKMFAEHTEYNQGITNAYKRLDAFTKDYVKQHSAASRAGQPYIIPVVFHVIHNYGIENISDAQILNAIEVLNKNYRKQNADTTDIVPAFKALAADCEIELRLARIDPNGNCTNGINRIASSLTFTGDHAVKSLIHWDPTKYLNVYVCADAAGIAGHALLPADADTIPEWDGIVLRHDYTGSIGTSNKLRSVVLSHELGHYFNLQHIWGGNNVPGFYYLPVGDAGNCAFDDDVNDTPNTIGWSTCNLSGSSCGSTLDNVQNFMDYAYCARMFTPGQKLRMHAALNSTVAHRNNLWSPANLIATGVDDAYSPLCDAAFDMSAKVICEGESIKFTDRSYFNTTSITWDFEGGAPDLSSDSVVTVLYTTAGTYDVSLTAANDTGEIKKTLSGIVRVLPAALKPVPFYESFEGYGSLADADFATRNLYADSLTFKLTSKASYSGSECVYIDNFNSPLAKSSHELITPTYDCTNLWVDSITFRYAFAYRDTTSADKLRVYVSSDCGKNWILKKTLVGNGLITTSGVSQAFFPSAGQWVKTSITGISGALLTDQFRIRFVFDGAGGNNFFLDDINIGNGVYNSVAEIKNTNVNVYPNPFSEMLTIVKQGGGASTVCQAMVYDITGREILAADIALQGEGSISIPTGAWAKGVYVVAIQSPNGNSYRKVVKE
jgi:PKD repeat protein